MKEDEIDVWEIRPADGGACYVLTDVDEAVASVRDYLEDVAVDDGFTIRRRTMIRAAYEALEEFDGF